MHFEKIPFEEWKKELKNLFPAIEDEAIETTYGNIKLPKQGTYGSMGMDFFAPFDIKMPGETTMVIPTGVRWVVDEANMDKGLCIYPRSGLGFKYGLYLENSVGIIDASFYLSDNYGHILIKLHNPYEDLEIPKHKAFAQGVVTQYFICDGAESNEKRNGGFGSTDKKEVTSNVPQDEIRKTLKTVLVKNLTVLTSISNKSETGLSDKEIAEKERILHDYKKYIDNKEYIPKSINDYYNLGYSYE